MRTPGRFTDSAGVTALYTPMASVEPGQVVVGGWRPYLVVARVEIDGTQARMHFEGGHVGGWGAIWDLVPVEVVE